jgi:site-specific recombinase XerD
MFLSQSIDDYRRAQEARGDSVSHRKQCACILASLLARLGDVPIADVQPAELRDFLAEMRRRPGRKNGRVSDHTISAYHRTLAAFFRYAYDEGWIRPNPMAKVPKPKLPQELVRPFSEDQLRRLLATPNTARFTGLRDVAMMTLLLDTGARISEVLNARLDDGTWVSASSG